MYIPKKVQVPFLFTNFTVSTVTRNSATSTYQQSRRENPQTTAQFQQTHNRMNVIFLENNHVEYT